MAKEFEIFYPNVYDEHDQKIIDAGYADAANLKPRPGSPKPIDRDQMVAYAKLWAQDYAKNTRWGGLMAYPAFKEPNFFEVTKVRR